MRFIKNHKTKKYKTGYVVRYEEYRLDEYEEETIIIPSAYTPTGDYIGIPKQARFLCYTKHIAPEKVDPQDKACSIGFCERDQRWYGWTYSKIRGYGLDESEYTTLDDCRQMAIAFARGEVE